MAHRKAIPLLEIEIKDLTGSCIVDGIQLNILGELILNDGKPFLSAKCDNYLLLSAIAHKTIDLTFVDSLGRRIECRKIGITHTDSDGGFESDDIIDIVIKKGNINNTDDVDFFGVIRCKEFSGQEFDQFGNRSINELSIMAAGAQLCSQTIPQIESGNGYLVSPLKHGDYADFKEKVLPKFHSLISFLFANFVSMPYQLVWKDPDNYIVEWLSTKYSTRGGGIFYTQYPGVIQNFFQKVWLEWDKYGATLELPVLVDYYVLIENETHVDVRLLLASVWMEAMKHMYAVNVAKYKLNAGGYFLKPGLLKGRFSFAELIQEVYSKFKITVGDTSFIPYRNEVVHRGKINEPIKDKLSIFMNLISTIDRLMLNILGYQGQIWDRAAKRYIDYP